MADGDDHEMSPALRAALEHRTLSQGIKNGRMFAWHDWRLHVDSNGCMSSPERIAQTREFASIVRAVLDRSGFWTGTCPSRTHSGPRNGYPWHAARRHLRAHCFQHTEVRFYVDPHRTGHDGAGPYGKPETCADFFSAALFRKVRASISSALINSGFFDRTERMLVGADKVRFDQRTNGHWTGDGLRITSPGRDDVDALKKRIVEGQIKAAYRWDGRLFVGTAYYGLNNMWRLVHGDEIAYVASFECFDSRPGLPHRFLSPSTRRTRIERLLAAAVAEENFERAAVLKRARDAPRGPTLVEMLTSLAETP